MAMQIYADVMGRPIEIVRSGQVCALGAAISAAVVAGPEAGGHSDFEEAMGAMTGASERVFEPIAENRATYDRLYAVYHRLHDAFGVAGRCEDLSDVMKDLLEVRDEVRSGAWLTSH
jgi:L-ribulokinase